MAQTSPANPNLSDSVHLIPFPYGVFAATGVLSAWNSEFERLLSEFQMGSLEAVSLDQLLDHWLERGGIPEARGREAAWDKDVRPGAHSHGRPFQLRVGEDWYQVHSSRLDGGGTSLLIVTVAQKENEDKALAESEAYFRTLFDRAPVSLFEEDWSGVKALIDELGTNETRNIRSFLLENPGLLTRMAATVRLCNANSTAVETYEAGSTAELIASFDGLHDYLGTDGMRDIFLSLVEGFLNGDGIVVHEGSDVTREGRRIYVKTTSTLLPPHEQSWRRVIQVLENITAFKEAQEQLHQAQKMEALGKLTGGVAHDFNNLLAVIQGNAELLKDTEGAASPHLAAIFRAAERGAELTQHLLAFARQQPLRPKAVDLSEFVIGMSSLLARLLGATVRLETQTQAGLWPAMADGGQVENALLNLVINARDAMPDGGELRIECRNVAVEADNPIATADITDGDYVVLSVTDSGTGMSEEVRKHAFEPFFTTKGVGQGSGLGLSMVYGFAMQSGGAVTVDSEVGEGTTVSLYLPRAPAETESGQLLHRQEAVPKGYGETVLVIEDDPEVRDLADLMLQKLGYAVLCARDARQARLAVTKHPLIRLVLSDVVLPGRMSGPEFAEELRTLNPDIRTIFMSGYPADTAGSLPEGAVLLDKPFRLAELARAVRTALEG